MDASLSDTQDILLRMRELAVKSASDNNTYLDRSFIQDEVNQITQELNKISQNTEFNSAKLLDGTLNKKITLGSDSDNTMIIDSQSTDSASIGAYKLNSVTEGQGSDRTGSDAAQTNGFVTLGTVGSHASAKSALDALFSADADYVVKGYFGTKTAKVDAGASARDVAKAFNLITGTTGVAASVETRARISHVTGNDSFSFTLQGKSSIASNVNVTISNNNNLSELKDAINSVSGSTGITASLTEDLAGVNLIQNEGYDIIIGDLTPSSTNNAMYNDTSTTPVSTGSLFEYSHLDHGFNEGDIVKYNSEVTPVTNLVDGHFYKIETVPQPKAFTLVKTDGSPHIYGGNGHAIDSFTKMNSFQVMTITKDQDTGELINSKVSTLGTSTSKDSMAIAGQISLSSSKAFSVTSGNANNHFSDNVSPLQSSFSSISSINLKTHNGSNEALSVIDGALNTISKLQSVTGAKEAHLLRVINNLTNIAIDTDKAKEQIEGINFASETSNLTVAQILSESATAMVTQATNNSKHLLQIINKE